MGGTYTGGTYTTKDGREVKLYNPTADIGRLDPRSFLRRSLADPVRFAVDAATTKPGRGEHYFEGHDTHNATQAAKLLLSAALAGVPGAREAMQQTGQGMVKPRNWLEDLLQGSTGVSVRLPK